MKRTWILLSLSLPLFLSLGCQMVHVTDAHGQAIHLARVSATTQSSGTSGMTHYTNAMGDVALPMSQEQPGTREYLEISKDGYLTRRIVRPEDGQVEVQLMKSPSASRSDAQKK